MKVNDSIEGYIVTLSGLDLSFTTRAGERLLESALRQGINLPYGCQNGNCGQCSAALLEGTVHDEGEQVTARQGEILTCQASACSDIKLQLTVAPELMALKVKTLPAKVEKLERLSDAVMRLVLRYPPGENFYFLPGQFIDLHYKKLVRSYSIAAHNEDAKQIELQISQVENGRFTKQLFNGMKKNELMRMEGPLGAFYVRQNIRPLLFLAGGTGFAPVQAMVQDLIDRGDRREISIYWWNSRKEDFYSTLPPEWQQHYSKIHYVPVLSRPDTGWSGRQGRLEMILSEDFTCLRDVDVYACGAPGLVDSARVHCQLFGVKKDAFFADPFTPSNNEK